MQRIIQSSQSTIQLIQWNKTTNTVRENVAVRLRQRQSSTEQVVSAHGTSVLLWRRRKPKDSKTIKSDSVQEARRRRRRPAPYDAVPCPVRARKVQRSRRHESSIAAAGCTHATVDGVRRRTARCTSKRAIDVQPRLTQRRTLRLSRKNRQHERQQQIGISETVIVLRQWIGNVSVQHHQRRNEQEPEMIRKCLGTATAAERFGDQAR